MTVYNELSSVDEYGSYEKKKKRFLNFVDSLFACFVATPLVVGAFRGTWHLVEIHYHEYCPFWQTFFTVSAILVTFTFFRRPFMDVVIEKQRHIKSFRKTAVRVILVRTYHYIFAVSCISFWLHLWDIVPRFIGKISD